MLEVKTLLLDVWTVNYTADTLQIGCENHRIEEWWDFDEERINSMDSKALKLWRKWKPILQQIIALSPAEPTDKESINV